MMQGINVTIFEGQYIRLILVCDFQILRNGLEQILSRDTSIDIVGVARTIEQALDFLQTSTPSLILYYMDTPDGPTVIEILSRVSQSKILVLNGTQNDAATDSVIVAGASGIVQRPDSAETLIKAIHAIDRGEIWVDRKAAGRIFLELTRKKAAEEQNPDIDRIALLTRKERLVVAEVANDEKATMAQLAEKLHISDNTLRNHLTSIYAKLGVTKRLELYVFANRHGLREMGLGDESPLIG